jgi:hypothetical protein
MRGQGVLDNDGMIALRTSVETWADGPGAASKVFRVGAANAVKVTADNTVITSVVFS